MRTRTSEWGGLQPPAPAFPLLPAPSTSCVTCAGGRGGSEREGDLKVRAQRGFKKPRAPATAQSSLRGAPARRAGLSAAPCFGSRRGCSGARRALTAAARTVAAIDPQLPWRDLPTATGKRPCRVPGGAAAPSPVRGCPMASHCTDPCPDPGGCCPGHLATTPDQFFALWVALALPQSPLALSDPLCSFPSPPRPGALLLHSIFTPECALTRSTALPHCQFSVPHNFSS